MKYIVNTQFFNFDRRGNAKTTKVGTILSQAQYNDLTAPKKAKCVEFVQDRQNVPYTEEEITTLLDSYVRSGNRQIVISEFIQNFVGTDHTESSLNRMCGQMETIDVNHPDSTNHVVSSKLIEVASDRYPDQFGTPEEVRQINLEIEAEKILAELVG